MQSAISPRTGRKFGITARNHTHTHTACSKLCNKIPSTQLAGNPRKAFHFQGTKFPNEIAFFTLEAKRIFELHTFGSSWKIFFTSKQKIFSFRNHQEKCGKIFSIAFGISKNKNSIIKSKYLRKCLRKILGYEINFRWPHEIFDHSK